MNFLAFWISEFLYQNRLYTLHNVIHYLILIKRSGLSICQTASNPSLVRMRYIVGATITPSTSIITPSTIIAWFNNEPYHSPPLALGLALNTVYKTVLGENYEISFSNAPLPYTTDTKVRLKFKKNSKNSKTYQAIDHNLIIIFFDNNYSSQIKNLLQGNTMGFQLAFNMGFSMAFVSSFYILFYVRERVCKSKHLQFISGVNVFIFWTTSLICDLISFIIITIAMIITLIAFQEDGFKSADDLGRSFF